MADFFYNEQEKEIFFYENLKTYKLNETAALIFELCLKNTSIEDITLHLAREYEVDIVEPMDGLQKIWWLLPSRGGCFTRVPVGGGTRSILGY